MKIQYDTNNGACRVNFARPRTGVHGLRAHTSDVGRILLSAFPPVSYTSAHTAHTHASQCMYVYTSVSARHVRRMFIATAENDLFSISVWRDAVQCPSRAKGSYYYTRRPAPTRPCKSPWEKWRFRLQFRLTRCNTWGCCNFCCCCCCCCWCCCCNVPVNVTKIKFDSISAWCWQRYVPAGIPWASTFRDSKLKNP